MVIPGNLVSSHVKEAIMMKVEEWGVVRGWEILRVVLHDNLIGIGSC